MDRITLRAQASNLFLIAANNDGIDLNITITEVAYAGQNTVRRGHLGLLLILNKVDL